MEPTDSTTRALMPQWLERNRLALPKRNGRVVSQEELAADITTTTGWHIARERYSKYESGGLPIGPDVARHLLDYWQSRGVAGPEVAPEQPSSEPTEASVMAELVAELRAWRLEDRQRIADLEATVARLAATSLAGPGSAAPSSPVPQMERAE